MADRQYKKSSFSCIQKMIKEAKGASIDAVILGNHLKIRWTCCGVKYQDTIAKTASDYRTQRNEIARIKRRIFLAQGELVCPT